MLTSIVNVANHTGCISLNNQRCKTQPILIILLPKEYIQGLRYNPFRFNLEISRVSCNPLNDLSDRVCVPNKTEDLSLHVFDMVAGKNESKTLSKYISCEYKYKLDGRNVTGIKSGTRVNLCVNNGVRAKIQKNIVCVKKIIFGILLHVVVKMANI